MATPRQAGRVTVEVVAVAGSVNFRKTMLMPAGQTIGWCVNASGLYGMRPELRGCKIGVWGKVVAPETVVAEGDRIEVYVSCDPLAVASARKRKRGVAKAADLGHNRLEES